MGRRVLSLDDAVDLYCLERSLSGDYERYVRSVARQFAAFCDHSGRPDRITDDCQNRWAAALRKESGPKSVKDKLAVISAIRRMLFERGDIPAPPLRVAKIKLPRPVPVAWSQDDMRRLLFVCRGLRGVDSKTGLRRSTFWGGLCSSAYDAGLRRSDMLRLRFVDIDGSGVLRLSQSKTGLYHVARLGVRSRRYIDALNVRSPAARDGRIFWWAKTKRLFYDELGAILGAAGLCRKNGILRRIRRTGATQVELEKPGFAWRYLGHSAPGLDQRYYIDKSHIPGAAVNPREL